MKDIILEIESLKENQRYSDAIVLLEENIVKNSSDYRLYEELADIYL